MHRDASGEQLRGDDRQLRGDRPEIIGRSMGQVRGGGRRLVVVRRDAQASGNDRVGVILIPKILYIPIAKEPGDGDVSFLPSLIRLLGETMIVCVCRSVQSYNLSRCLPKICSLIIIKKMRV